MATVYLALGSNLNEPIQQMQLAIRALQNNLALRWIQASSLYQSEPLLDEEAEAQPAYVNAVVKIETNLPPEQLLAMTQSIENQQGRVRQSKRWQARVIDIDIILYDDIMIETPALTIPHPEMLKREFVLLPLFEIAPERILPDGTALSEAINRCRQATLLKLKEEAVV